MMKRRLISLFLILAMLTGIVSAAGTYRLPYAIKVNRAMNTVTIYEPDENGVYTVPVKAMICSTGREGSETPTGTFYLIDYRSEWRLMLDGTYGQYATCFLGNFLFHSICYSDDSNDAMVREAYNNLGNAASMGCVRLQTVDAKWIFDNCPAGTQVTIYDDPESPGPLGKPDRLIDEITEDMYNGWDPTDPAEGNPWNLEDLKSVKLNKYLLNLTAGETGQFRTIREPSSAMVLWYSSDEAVAKVDQSGKVTAISKGIAKITAKGINGVYTTGYVTVTGELLPFEDLQPGAWYYPDVRYALDAGLFNGVNERSFAPDGAVSRAMAVQVLYNLAGKPRVTAKVPFEDVESDAWYAKAVAWAVEEGITSGVSKTEFAPDRAMSRQDLAALVWRYADKPNTLYDLNIYHDVDDVADYARDAFGWMKRNYMTITSGRELRPRMTATRAELASILSQALQKELISP